MTEEFTAHITRELSWDDQRLAGDAPTTFSPTESIAYSFGYNSAIEAAKKRQLPGNHMDIGEFRRLGLLQEINRRFLHPIGLALAVEAAKDDEEPIVETLAYIIDSRDDPEGFCFAGIDVNEAAHRANYYDAEVAARSRKRRSLFGEPIGLGGWQPLHKMNMEVPND